MRGREIRITFIGQTIQQFIRRAFKIQIDNNPAFLSGKVGCWGFITQIVIRIFVFAAIKLC